MARLGEPERTSLGLGALSIVLMATACSPAKPPVDPEPSEPEPVASSPPATPPPAPTPSLYERLGKLDGLGAVVDELMGDVLADKRINKLFDKARKDRERAKQLRTRLIAELCVVAGGGDECGYDGKTMKEAHASMNVSEAQWNAFVEDLTIALKTRNVDDALSGALVKKLEQQTKGDIVAPGKGK